MGRKLAKAAALRNRRSSRDIGLPEGPGAFGRHAAVANRWLFQPPHNARCHCPRMARAARAKAAPVAE